MESVVNVLIFYAIYILHLKHVLDLLQYYQMNFLLKEKFIKVVHYLSNLFINDILNNCEKYGVSIGRKKKKKKKKKCCGGLFADDVVLIAQSAKKKKFRNIIKKKKKKKKNLKILLKKKKKGT